MMSLWDALRMNMMISYQELVRTFLSVVVNAAQRTRVKVEADSRPSVDTHPSGVQPSLGTGRHPAPQLYAVCSPGGTSLYPCFRLVPSFLQNREEHHRTTGS